MLISKVIQLSGRLYPFNFCNSRSRKILMLDDPRKVKNKYFHGECKILSNNECDHLWIDIEHIAGKTCLQSSPKHQYIVISIPCDIDIFPAFLYSSHTLLYVANKKYIIQTYNFEIATKR